MEIFEVAEWKPIHVGMVGNNRTFGSRKVKIERGGGATLRVITSALVTKEEIVISGSTPNELEERLVVYGEFTDAQAREIIRKVMFRG